MLQPLRQEQAAALVAHITMALTAIDARPTSITVVPHPKGLVISATIRSRTGHVIIPPGWTADYAEVARLLKDEASTDIVIPTRSTPLLN